MADNEIYETFCKDRFDRLEGSINRVLHSLEGNGEPGIKVEIDRLKRGWAFTIFLLSPVYLTLISQAVQWVFKILQAKEGG